MTEHMPEGHECSGLSDCMWSYPTFDDNPRVWGLLPEEPLTEAQLRELEAEP
jgi:hypothetical protein